MRAKEEIRTREVRWGLGSGGSGSSGSGSSSTSNYKTGVISATGVIATKKGLTICGLAIRSF